MYAVQLISKLRRTSFVCIVSQSVEKAILNKFLADKCLKGGGSGLKLLGSKRKVHRTTIFLKKDWEDGENTYYRESLCKLGRYNSSLFLKDSKPKFSSLKNNSNGLDDQNITLAKDIDRVEDDVLKVMIMELGSLEESSSNKYIEARRILNEECERRRPSWSVDTQLQICDCWYICNLGTFSSKKYMREYLSGISSLLKKLTPQQLVHSMFYVNLCRSMPPSWSQPLLESALLRVLDNLTTDELAVVAAGFFKSSTQIKTTAFYNAFIAQIIQDCSIISDVALCSTLKLIRYSSSLHLKSWKYINDLMDACTSTVPRRNTMTCGQLALLGVPLKLHHTQLLNSVADRLHECIASARVKDMTYIIQALALLNTPNTHPCIDKVIEEFQSPLRREEVSFYGHNLVPFLYFLALLNKYPQDLINHGLKPHFIGKSHHANYSTAAVMEISLTIECPNYNGNRVQPKHLKQFIKKIHSISNSREESFVKILQDEVYASLTRCLGSSDCITVINVLPHFNHPDIVIRLDKNGKGVSLKEEKQWRAVNILQGEVRWVPSSTDVWVAVVVGGNSQYVRPSFITAAGYHAFKMRQLERVGYRVLPIRSMEFKRLSAERRIEYLRKRLNECLRDVS